MRLLRRGVMRMIMRQLAMAWTLWYETAMEAKRTAFMCGGAIRRMLNRKLSMAWEKWQFTAAELARQQFMLNGAVTRMRNRQMSMAWEKWQEVYADLKFANRMGGGAIRRMLNRKLSMAGRSGRKCMLISSSPTAWEVELSVVCSTASFRWLGRSGSSLLLSWLVSSSCLQAQSTG